MLHSFQKPFPKNGPLYVHRRVNKEDYRVVNYKLSAFCSF